MPIEADVLAATADAYVEPMTSIRGRRVRRLLMREFARYDHVLPATAEDGAAALLALGEDGRVALCRTDGRGPAAAVSEWARLEGATVTTSYDLAKDSLPILGWTLWHPSFDRAAGALTISGAALAEAGRRRIAEALRPASAGSRRPHRS
jgi:hypothetical protein